MPNRILKDSINDSKGLSRVSPFAQDLYKRIITYADDYGRFNADLEIMRARLYAREFDAISLEALSDALVDLVGENKITLYTTSARCTELYGYFPNWKSHNRIRNTRTKYPEPEVDVNDWYCKRFIPVEVKTKIFIRDNFVCKKCRRDFSLPEIPVKEAIRLLNGAMHVDHIVPVIQGGRTTEENLQLLCASCNLSKAKLLPISQLMPVVATCSDLPQPAANRSNLRQSAADLQLEPTAATCGDLLQPAARIQSESNPNPIQSNPNPNPNPSDDAFKKVVKVFEDCGGVVASRAIADQLSDAEQEYGAEIVIAAFKKASDGGHAGVGILNYCRPIFEQYKARGIPSNHSAAAEVKKPSIPVKGVIIES